MQPEGLRRSCLNQENHNAVFITFKEIESPFPNYIPSHMLTSLQSSLHGIHPICTDFPYLFSSQIHALCVCQHIYSCIEQNVLFYFLHYISYIFGLGHSTTTLFLLCVSWESKERERHDGCCGPCVLWAMCAHRNMSAALEFMLLDL